MRWGVALVFVVAACGDNALPQDAVRSGSRLRAMYFADAEGDRIFRGWFDRDLGVECAWTGGPTPRCLPVDRIDTTVFADPACAQPLVEIVPPAEPDPCAPPLPAYVGVRRDPCVWDSIDEVWRLDSTTATPANVYRWNADTGECTAQPADAAYVYHRAGAPLALDGFVGGERVDDVGRARIRTRTIVADDGALAPLGAFDAELAVACTLDRERGCLPEASFAGLAEDEACERPVITAATACEPPAYIGMSQVEPTAYFARGEVWTSDPAEVVDLFNMSIIVVGTGWSCEPFQATVVEGYTLYHAGARLADDAFAAVTEERGDGVRIVPEYLRAGGHREATGYRDLATDLPCFPTEVATGAWRCLPYLHGIWTRFFFSDPACTQPMEVLFHYGDEPSLPGLRGERVGACGFRLRAQAPGTLLPLGTYFASFDGMTCEAYDPGDPGVTAYTVGADVPLDAYAELQRVTD